ncbi:ZIP family metal transporter [Flavobacterium branchiophilum]|uniref:Probable zinc/iron permease n=1 Tax=Flavobacterium branchiophilum (strain FL-15) TaxID=1034807 RepID=G2Z240_FLABF|nr:ZIP family metal transporter [Flavobacterium branchiophilum]CCB69991.1 Probable zinc/iron permease [Flavobacterium branchiophilum FL-15]
MYYILPLFSVIIGYLVALFLKPKNKKNLKLLLAFSGSFLLSITVMHLLPEVYEQHEGHAGLWIMMGILFQIILEFFSKGAEHGHVHGHQTIDNIPWLLFVSLCIHALLEGFPIQKSPDLAIGIAIHHLPIAIILTTFFAQAQLNQRAIFIFMIVFAIMTPLGTFLSAYILLLQQLQMPLTAIVIGILFHISSTIIFESSEGHKFNIAKITMIILGIGLGFFI